MFLNFLVTKFLEPKFLGAQMRLGTISALVVNKYVPDETGVTENTQVPVVVYPVG